VYVNIAEKYTSTFTTYTEGDRFFALNRSTYRSYLWTKQS